MHLGKQTNPEDYYIAGKKIGNTECEIYLSVLVSSDGTWHKQINTAAWKANWVLGIMKNTFSSCSDKIARIIYPTFVRLHDWNSLHQSTWFL